MAPIHESVRNEKFPYSISSASFLRRARNAKKIKRKGRRKRETFRSRGCIISSGNDRSIETGESKAISANLINPTTTLCASRQSRRRMVAACLGDEACGRHCRKRSFSSRSTATSNEYKIVATIGEGIYIYIRERNLWPSKPVDEEWRRNTYFIHIHSGFVVARHRRFARGGGRAREAR